jgi:hypothetical protein
MTPYERITTLLEVEHSIDGPDGHFPVSVANRIDGALPKRDCIRAKNEKPISKSF